VSLTEGTQLGVYEVTGQIGAGGMGEVYRAADTKLGREVAIKTLPAGMADDPDRLARFEREAKLLASLNHAHIASVHSLDEHEGTLYIAMELVEGQTLEETLKTGPLSVDDALQVSLQIASALEAAHEKGVVHRDLKPANVMLTGDGFVKVLDFGLAKAFSGDPTEASPGQSPALSMAMTQQGIILGTAAYMSPEQASGQASDQRADIWAFGVVLYEMLTGQALFGGESVAHILGGVLRLDPDWSQLPDSLDPRLQRVLERCLKKRPRERYHAIADVRIDVEEILREPEAATPVSIESADTAPASTFRRFVLPAAALVIGAAVAGVAVWAVKPEAPEPVTRFAFDLPDGQLFQNSSRNLVAFSPDGSRFVYNTSEGVYLRTLNAEAPRLLSGTEAIVRNPVFSPDGEWVAYYSNPENQIKKIAVTGGAPVTLADTETLPFGMSWEADGTILFGQSAGVIRVSENGGEATVVIEARDGEQVHGPQLLPGGDWVLFSSATTAGQSRWDEASIVAESIETGDRRVLVRGGSAARYLPTGHLLYALEDDLFALPFDSGNLEVQGGPVSVIEGVERANNPQSNTGTGHFSVSDQGHIVYVEGGTALSQERTLALVDRNGGLARRLDVPRNQYVAPRLSPEGDRVVVQTDGGDQSIIWIYDLNAGTAIRRLAVEGNNVRPLWTPDGEQVVFASDRDGPISIYAQNADGSGVAERLTTSEEGVAHWPEAISRDGQTLVYKVEQSVAGGWNANQNEMDLWTMPMDSPNDAEPFAAAPYPVLEIGASFSPDGRWLAYTVGDGPAVEYSIWAQPFPPTGELRRISEEFGVMPLWSRDGDELFYRPITTAQGMRQTLRSIRMTTSPSFSFTSEQAVSIGDFLSFSYFRSFDVTPDGEQFLVVLPAETDGTTEAQRPRLHVVLNWYRELLERVPAP
jgi:serine/threonine-protein kinase